ncbi:Uncharacterised protein [Mycobacteroides abscessus subsp. abscessus]|nr:Uncharacterised protein [Mycobacteroides abscessus subsp. abscessus]
MPSASSWATKTSIAGPFSACIIVISPVAAPTCMARTICASSL